MFAIGTAPIWVTWLGIIGIALIAGIWILGKTGSMANNLKKVGYVSFAGFVLLAVYFNPGVFTGTDATVVDPDDIETDYTIVWVLDSTTAVISADFAQTDEVAAGEYQLESDAEGNTVGVTVQNTCTTGGGTAVCTWDAFSFTNTITAEFKSKWSEGARITSVLGASVDSSIVDWGIVSNGTPGVVMTIIDRSPLNVPGLIWVDGAGTNKAVGATSCESLNEFSAGESVTSAGFYFAMNENSLHLIPVGVYSTNYDIVYSDDYGFSHTVVLTYTMTTA